MKMTKIPPCKHDMLHVVIETPSGSRNKYVFDEELGIFKLKKTLPLGMSFPFDFGFVPNTKGADGDPLDVLVIMEDHGYPGCLVECRALGVLEAEQKEKGRTFRNDRIIAVPASSILYQNIKSVDELNKHMVQQIEHFFEDYNRHEGKEFIPLQWAGTKAAISLVKKADIKKK